MKQDMDLVRLDNEEVTAWVRKRTDEDDETWPSPYKWRAMQYHTRDDEDPFFPTQREAKAWLLAIVQLEDKT